MSLGVTANEWKNGALLAYIAKNIPGINLRKLLKILYLIDEKFMKLRGFPLTWFDYYAWAKGPVAPEVYAVKDGAFPKYVVCHKDTKGKDIVEPVLQNDYHVFKQMDEFSPYEIEGVDDVILEYANSTADELSALTHEEDSLWSRIVRENHVKFIDGKSSVLIPLKLLNGDAEDKNETYEDARWNMSFQAALNRHRIEADVPTT